MQRTSILGNDSYKEKSTLGKKAASLPSSFAVLQWQMPQVILGQAKDWGSPTVQSTETLQTLLVNTWKIYFSQASSPHVQNCSQTQRNLKYFLLCYHMPILPS